MECKPALDSVRQKRAFNQLLEVEVCDPGK